MIKNQDRLLSEIYAKNTVEYSIKSITIGSVLALSGLFQTAAYASGIVGDGTPGSCTESALDEALTDGGNVSFDCGSNPKTIYIGSEKVITANTLINGGNVITIDGGNAKRIFSVQNEKNLTVTNLTLVNGYTTGQGGAISAKYQNKIIVNHCTFTNNISTQLGEKGGGAIFSGNGALTIDNSNFSGNKASIGGAIRILNSNLNVTASSFSRNKAVNSSIGNGGAVYVDGARGDDGKIVIRTSSFKENSATAYGGALFNNIYNNNTTAITDSVFSANTVGGGSNGQGGAIWSNGDPAKGGHWLVNANNTTLTLVNTTLANNTAGTQGGGIFLGRHPAGTVISQSSIYGNKTVKSMGGGILQTGNGNLSVVNSTIADNTVNGTYAMGAGIYIGNNATAKISNATIANNVANWQAGGIFGGNNVTLKNTILANNLALNGGNNWNIKHNCFQPMSDGGDNLQYPKPIDAPCTPNIQIDDPKLGNLKNNGGRTLTLGLQPGSAASRMSSSCPKADQRGKVRAQPAGTDCDIGAVEVNL